MPALRGIGWDFSDSFQIRPFVDDGSLIRVANQQAYDMWDDWHRATVMSHTLILRAWARTVQSNSLDGSILPLTVMLVADMLSTSVCEVSVEAGFVTAEHGLYLALTNTALIMMGPGKSFRSLERVSHIEALLSYPSDIESMSVGRPLAVSKQLCELWAPAPDPIVLKLVTFTGMVFHNYQVALRFSARDRKPAAPAVSHGSFQIFKDPDYSSFIV